MVSKDRQKPKISVLVLTPYKIIRESLHTLIEENRDMKVDRAASDIEKLIETGKINDIDIVLIYLMENDTDTVEIIGRILEAATGVRVIIVAGAEDFVNQTRAIELGAVGIVQREQNARMLVEAIRHTYRGETWINQVLLTKLLNKKTQKKNGPNGWNSVKSDAPTRRELEVIRMIGCGLRNREIALKMSISEATVRHHLSAIYGKLGIADRLNLVIYAYQNGLIDLTEQPVIMGTEEIPVDRTTGS